MSQNDLVLFHSALVFGRGPAITAGVIPSAALTHHLRHQFLALNELKLVHKAPKIVVLGTAFRDETGALSEESLVEMASMTSPVDRGQFQLFFQVADFGGRRQSRG